jgi:hypothetical protein
MEGSMEDEKKTDKESRPADDADVKAPTGMGMKVAVTLIIIVAIAAALGAAYYFILLPEQKRKAELQKHEDFMAEYTRLRNTGYDDFWKCVFPLAAEEQANTNLKLESIINNAVSQNEEGFGKHIMGCLETLKGHIDSAKELQTMPQYEESVKQLAPSLETVYDTWKSLGEEFANAGQRAKWDKRLDEVTAKGWGQMYVDAEKGKKSSDTTQQNARRYMKFVTCVVGKSYQEMGNTVSEVEQSLVKEVLDGVCSTPEKAVERYKHLENNCVPFLVGPEPPPADEDWAHVIKKGLYYETRSLAVIAGSWEGRQGCLRTAREEKEKLMIQNLFNAWISYKKVAKSVEDAYLKATKELKKK